MNDVNVVSITGNLTADPELRATAGGTQVLNFRIASNYSVKNKQTGEWEDRANFISCVAMGARAEPLSRLLGKGDKVAVSGSLRQHSWESDDGQRHSMVEIYVERVVLMSKPLGNAPQTPQGAAQAPAAPGQVYDDDLPW